MLKRVCQCLVGLALLPIMVRSQGGTVWSQAANGLGGTDLKWEKIAAAADGTVAACATEHQATSTFLVQGWNPDGTVKFIYRYPDPAGLYEDGAVDIIADGNEFAVVGYTNHGVPSGQTQTLLVRLDSNGNALFEHMFDLGPGTTFDESPVDMVRSGHGVIIAANQNYVGYVARIEGTTVDWNTTIQDPNNTMRLESISDGLSLLVVGQVGNAGGARDVFTMSLDNGALFQHLQFPTDQAILDTGGQDYVLTSVTSSGEIVAYKIDVFNGIDYMHVFGGTFYNGGQIEPGLDNSAYIVYQDSLAGQMLMNKWKFAPDTVSTDIVNNLAGPGRDYVLRTDQFGNPVVMGSTQDNNMRVNLAAWSWDKNLARQWHVQLTGNPSRDELPTDFVIDRDQRFYGVGKSTDPVAGDTKAVSWRVKTWYQAHPDTVRTVLGRHLSGGVDSLQSTDGLNYVSCRFFVPNQQIHPINIEFETEFPIDNVLPGSTSHTLFLTISSDTTGVVQSVQLFDWTAGSFSDEAITFLSPITIQVQLPGTGNLSRFYEPGTRRVKARTRIKQFGPTTSYGFCGFLDEVRWESFAE
ncbi:MAG: hypothetical protein JNM34_12425 [Chthonomonadaceae bacterium]|nr:hypothetical protein [Chthonomonadaceae bacterium]